MDANEGVNCLLRMVFDCQTSPILLLTRSESEAPPPLLIQNHRTLPTIHTIRNNALPIDLQPSSFLLNIDWITMVTTCFRGNKNYSMRISGDLDKIKRCNALYHLLNNRYHNRILNFPDDRKQDHFTTKWFRNDLPRFCCLMILLGHVVDDIGCASTDSTLLSHPQDHFVAIPDTAEELEGFYLHYNRVKHRWVRSGLALGSDKLPLRSMSYVQSNHIVRSKMKRYSKCFGMFFLDRTLDCDSLIRMVSEPKSVLCCWVCQKLRCYCDMYGR